MKLPVFLALLIGLCLSIPESQAQTTLPADSGHFTINQGNHSVGRSDFSIQPVRQGKITTPSAWSVTSHGTLTLQNTSYSFSASGSLDKDLVILQENLNGVVNGSAVTFAVRSNGGNFAIDISANGRSYGNSLNRPAQAVFFPGLRSFQLRNPARHHRRPSRRVNLCAYSQTERHPLGRDPRPQTDVQATLNGASITVPP